MLIYYLYRSKRKTYPFYAKLPLSKLKAHLNYMPSMLTEFRHRLRSKPTLVLTYGSPVVFNVN